MTDRYRVEYSDDAKAQKHRLDAALLVELNNAMDTLSKRPKPETVNDWWGRFPDGMYWMHLTHSIYIEYFVSDHLVKIMVMRVIPKDTGSFA